jgi:uncharacterized protein (DUF1778 family)
MSKQRKGVELKKAGRPKSGRITITVRLSPEQKDLLDRGAEKSGLDKSAYVRQALLSQLKRNGLKPS